MGRRRKITRQDSDTTCVPEGKEKIHYCIVSQVIPARPSDKRYAGGKVES
jgi:hypothetical protein